METDLRKLLVEEHLPLKCDAEQEKGRLTKTVESVVYDTQPGQTLLAISQEGDSIVAVSAAKRFFPPLVEFTGPQAEGAIQERVLALFVASVEQSPTIPKKHLVASLREQLGLDEKDPLRVLVSNKQLAVELEKDAEVFVGDGPDELVIGIKGKPGALVTTPVGVGIFIEDVGAVAGARAAP